MIGQREAKIKIRNIKVSNLIHKPKSLKLHIQEIIEYIREIEP
jgi:hypothetical protein